MAAEVDPHPREQDVPGVSGAKRALGRRGDLERGSSLTTERRLELGDRGLVRHEVQITDHERLAEREHGGVHGVHGQRHARGTHRGVGREARTESGDQRGAVVDQGLGERGHQLLSFHLTGDKRKVSHGAVQIRLGDGQRLVGRGQVGDRRRGVLTGRGERVNGLDLAELHGGRAGATGEGEVLSDVLEVFRLVEQLDERHVEVGGETEIGIE